MGDSKLRYTFVALDSQHILHPPTMADTVPVGLYLATNGKRHIANEYDTIAQDTALRRLWIQAEEARNNGDDTRAQKNYLALAQHCPTSALVRTALAELYLYQGDSAQAKESFLRALHDNPFAYTAHRHLAELYASVDSMEQAVEHITWAHLYNRTDTTILGLLLAMYERNGTPYDAWTFQPKYALLHKPNDECEIATDTKEGAWVMYALCKALWRFELSYTTPLANTMHASLPVVENYEALYVLADAARYMYPNNSCPTASIRQLVKAVDNGDIDSFYLYEQFLPRSPQTVLFLSEKERQQLFVYLKKYRTKQDVPTMKK